MTRFGILTHTARAAVAGAVVALGAVVLPVSPAVAAATGSITPTSGALSPGQSTTVTATFVRSGTLPSEVRLEIAPVGGVTGSVTITAAPTSGNGAVSFCDVDASGLFVDCLWSDLANPQSGDLTVTVSASADAAGVFALSSTTLEDPGTGIERIPVAGPVNLFVVGAFVTPTVSVAPTSVTPGSSATVSAGFTIIADATSLPLKVGVGLIGTSGAGSLVPGATTNLTNCELDPVSQRRYDCDVIDDSVGATASITLTVAASAAATVGSTWSIDASQVSPRPSGGGAFTEAPLQIVAPEVTTTTPTTTAPPATTAGPATTVPATTPVTLPNTGSGDEPTLTLWALGALALGVTLIVVARRRSVET